jgi:hypothetical protein
LLVLAFFLDPETGWMLIAMIVGIILTITALWYLSMVAVPGGAVDAKINWSRWARYVLSSAFVFALMIFLFNLRDFSDKMLISESNMVIQENLISVVPVTTETSDDCTRTFSSDFVLWDFLEYVGVRGDSLWILSFQTARGNDLGNFIRLSDGGEKTVKDMTWQQIQLFCRDRAGSKYVVNVWKGWTGSQNDESVSVQK